MFDTVRIALVAEGITDYEVIRAAIESMLNGRSFDLKLLQPEGSVAFVGAGDAGALGGGWRGVYKWCLQARRRSGGGIDGDPLFNSYDLLLIHLDADVASQDPARDANHPIPELESDLPCEQPCPPPSATTNRLRQLLLSWVGAVVLPPRIVLCTPSKSTEAWMLAVFFPHDREMLRRGWECHPNPAGRLGQQPKKMRFAKTHADYERRKVQIQAGWPRIAQSLSEARRFQVDFETAIVLLGR